MDALLKQIRFNLSIILTLVILMIGIVILSVFYRPVPADSPTPVKATDAASIDTAVWKAPEISSIKSNQLRAQVEYGKSLIVNTSKFLGPAGSVAHLTNGMNCQNCHLDAGTKPWGNNYSAVSSTYPKFRARSGTKETIVKRISDCFERSLNGAAPNSNSKEMKAMVAYMEFLGTGVAEGVKPKGAGLIKLPYLNRAADPKNGAIVYRAKCASCHGSKGEGIAATDKASFIYPPLWGKDSYNDGAGLYRISNFAGYIKNNMPFGASYKNTLLSNEEAWDIAAFVNTQARPHKDQSKDWSDISKKPIDFAFGPYADQFSEAQHKLGPFNPIAINRKNK